MGCFRRLCRYSAFPSFRHGLAGPRCHGWQKLPVNSREITIAKTLRPGTNIRVVMSIVEEELHSPAKETRIEGWNRREAPYSTRGTEISRLARVEYAPTALFHPTFSWWWGRGEFRASISGRYSHSVAKAATKSCCRPWRLGPGIPCRDDEGGCFR